jgi:hypothetical protein
MDLSAGAHSPFHPQVVIILTEVDRAVASRLLLLRLWTPILSIDHRIQLLEVFLRC